MTLYWLPLANTQYNLCFFIESFYRLQQDVESLRFYFFIPFYLVVMHPSRMKVQAFLNYTVDTSKWENGCSGPWHSGLLLGDQAKDILSQYGSFPAVFLLTSLVSLVRNAVSGRLLGFSFLGGSKHYSTGGQRYISEGWIELTHSALTHLRSREEGIIWSSWTKCRRDNIIISLSRINHASF